MASQALAARGQDLPPMARERKIDATDTETAYLAIYRDASNGGLLGRLSPELGDSPSCCA